MVESASVWLLERLGKEKQETLVQIATVLWGIWSARNNKVWDQKQITPEIAMQWSKKQVAQWRELRSARLGRAHGGRNGHSQGEIRSSAPTTGRVKINVDASVFTGSSSFAIGMILRDHLGAFIQAKNLRRAGEISVFEAETWGVLEALKWIETLQISNVDIESDSQLTINAITRGKENYLEVGSVLQECCSIIRLRPDVTISFVKKQANKGAHLLARVPCLVNCSNLFLSPPLSVLETVMYEASLI